MTVQFNLLPDVKLEYIKARRMKRMVMGVSVIVAGITLAIFIGLFLLVNVVQKSHIANLNSDIEQKSSELQSKPDIDKIITIQNQLNSLTALHENKPQASRTIKYLTLLTPSEATVSQVTVSFEEDTMTIDGDANKLETVNKFADTLKFTTYKVEGSDTEPQNAFSEVVLESFGVTEEGATYQLSMKFNPEIFDNTKKVELIVPDIISTRSQTEKPEDLFQSSGESNTNGGTQ